MANTTLPKEFTIETDVEFRTWPRVSRPQFALVNGSASDRPLIIADGQNVAVYLNGKPGKLDGTSASCPIFASLINRIIEERIKAGKGPLGFINPVLYEHPEVLNDITYAAL